MLKNKELIGNLAVEEHLKWARWIRYIFNKCEKDEQGNFIVPAKYVYEWIRLGVSEFEDLDAQDQEKYRIEARKTLQVISNHFIKNQD